MSIIRLAVLTVPALLTSLTLGIPGSARAQQPSAPAIVGVTGTADVGGTFAGTLLITRFDPRSDTTDGIVAVGSISGVLNGRNVATRVAIPVTVAPTSTTPASTSTATTSTSCDAIHVDLGPSAFRALGSVVTLDLTGLDLAASDTDESMVTVTPTGTTASLTPTQVGTPVPTSPLGSEVPGTISPVPQTTSLAQTSAQPLGELLCSISSGTSSSSAQLASELNQVLLALQQ